jgi:energy-coupling factor transporter ATP-binding protein EcfA2
MARIAFIGAPGTGKSTLAQMLVPLLKMDGLDVEFCGEYSRIYLRRSGPPQTPFEQFAILAGACEREDELDIHDFVVCDSASFVSDVYFQYERLRNHRNADPVKLDRGYHEIVRMSRNRLKKFQHIFYVPVSDFGTGKDPSRIYVEDQRLLDRMLHAYLDYTLADYHTVQASSVDDRLREVRRVLHERDAFRGLLPPRP